MTNLTSHTIGWIGTGHMGFPDGRAAGQGRRETYGL